MIRNGLYAPQLRSAAVRSPLQLAPGAAELYTRLAAVPQRRSSLTAGEQKAVWREAFLHPVAGLDDPSKLKKYDPTGAIGFCFGRAMAVHLLARKLGLGEQDVKKLFVVGDLRSGDKPQWRFHVTTLVRGADGGWHAIDPILAQPMPARAWIEKVEQVWDKQHKARFYLTPAAAVLPDLSRVSDEPTASDRLINLGFDPAAHPGFLPRADLGARATELASAGVTDHFNLPGSAKAPFDFHGANVNDSRFDYAGYFHDLLSELVRRPALTPVAAAPESSADTFTCARQPGGGTFNDLAPADLPLGLDLSRLKP